MSSSEDLAAVPFPGQHEDGPAAAAAAAAGADRSEPANRAAPVQGDHASRAAKGSSRRRIIVGISGASGTIYGVRLLQHLKALDIETHLVVSKSAQVTMTYEMPEMAGELRSLADVSYANTDIGAAISSGSFRTLGMIIAPCSIKTLSEVATGVTSSLLSRSADVVLKERRRLVMMVRETPLHIGHLRSMMAVTEAGAIVCPPVPALYARPASIEQMVDHTLGRVLDLFDLEASLVRRWKE